MLAMLFAMSMAATPSPTPPIHITMSPSAERFLLDQPRRFALREAAVCKAAGRLQTAYEPALLYRDKDRAAGRMRRLIDLPQASACLLGGQAPEATVSGEAK